MTTKPFEELDEAARSESTGGRAVKQAALTAVAGAVAAGLAGAAKAMLDRRGDDDAHADRDDSPRAEEADTQDDAPAAVADDAENRDEAADDSDDREDEAEPEAGARDEASDDRQESEGSPEGAPEPTAASGADDGDPEANADDGDGDGDRERGEPQESRADDSREQLKGASAGDAREVVEQARRELQELLGVEPERVSGFQRADGRWTVTVEVVDVRRIPESTDVLASYDVTLDDDRNLVSVAQTRRYRRSQVEEG